MWARDSGACLHDGGEHGVDIDELLVVDERVELGYVALSGVEEHDAVRAGLEQADLVLLRQLHEAGHHFREVDDLLHARRQLVRQLDVQQRLAQRQHALQFRIAAALLGR